MTDAAQVLPKELRLTAPPTLPQARSYLFKQKSSLPAYNEKEVIQINIPRLQRSYLTKGSYLKFKLALSGDWGAADAYYNLHTCLDTPGAYGLIDRIEVYDYLGSTLLESTSGHGQLQALLLDTGINPNGTNHHLNMLAGTGRSRMAFESEFLENYVLSNFNSTLTISSEANVLNDISSLTTIGPVSGQILTPSAKHGLSASGAKAQTIYYEFALPLHSFLGTQSKQFVPLHNGFTIYLTLNSMNSAFGANNQFSAAANANPAIAIFKTGALTGYQLQDVYYCAQVLELGPVAESLLLSSSQGQPLIVHTKAYRNFTDSVAASTSSYRLDLPLNVSSMTALLWIMRAAADVSDITKRSLSNRIRNNLQSWFFQYGSSVLPQTSGIAAQNADAKALSSVGFTEAYAELMKAVNQFSEPQTVNSLITYEGYTNDQTSLLLLPEVPTTDTAFSKYRPMSANVPGKFAAGLNLELVSKKESDVISGLNTNGMNISLTANFKGDQGTIPGTSTATGAHVLARVDAWCVYDAYINISPGLASTVAF